MNNLKELIGEKFECVHLNSPYVTLSKSRSGYIMTTKNGEFFIHVPGSRFWDFTDSNIWKPIDQGDI